MIGPPFVNCKFSSRGSNWALYLFTLSTNCSSEDLTINPEYCSSQLDGKWVLIKGLKKLWSYLH